MGPKRKLATSNNAINTVNERGLSEVTNMEVLIGASESCVIPGLASPWLADLISSRPFSCSGHPTLPQDPILALTPDPQILKECNTY